MTNVFQTGFAAYACAGDTITAQHDGFALTATIHRDEDSGAPDEEMQGFWPSLDPKDCGYIGHKSQSTLRRHKARAQMIMDAWRNDEWFWCGIAVTVSRNGIDLTGEYDHALWSVDCNYPVKPRGKADNWYLLDVANELASEALESARAALASLCQCEEAA